MPEFAKKKNKYLLQGRNGEIALKLLNDVTDILDYHKINYWLDFGTLLGIVREQRILPWDDDMDISISPEDTDVFYNKVLPDLNKARYRTYHRKYKRNLGPFAQGETRAFKVRNNQFLFLRGFVKLDIFVLKNFEDNTYWCELGELHSISSSYLQEFSMIDFNGKQYRIPKDFDGYLTAHYGDWKTPKPDYNSSIDNGRTLSDKNS